MYKIINGRKRIAVKFADHILTLTSKAGLMRVPENPVPLMADKNQIRKILLIRLAYIGDVIMTLPVIAPLKEAFPEAEIHFLTSSAASPLLDSYPGLDRVISFDAPWFYKQSPDSTGDMIGLLSKEQYDLGIDFRADIRNIFHCLWSPRIPRRLSYTSGGGGSLLTHPVVWEKWKHKVEFHLDILRGAGIFAASTHPRLDITPLEQETARQRIESLIASAHPKPIAIHPGTRMPLKMWPWQRFQNLIRWIEKEHKAPVVILGGSADAAIIRQITADHTIKARVMGILPIRELAAVLSQCTCLICHDSAPMHMAAAVGTHVIALFGPSDLVETAPCGSGHRIIQMPCQYRSRCDENTCLDIKRSGRCMQSITVDHVIHELTKIGG